MIRTLLLLSLLLLTSVACRQPAGDAPAAPSNPDASTEAAPAVEYEPAYPTDVSSEELSEADLAQQETHSHGAGEEHSHGEGEAHDGHQH